jgi:hypothetical protein
VFKVEVVCDSTTYDAAHCSNENRRRSHGVHRSNCDQHNAAIPRHPRSSRRESAQAWCNPGGEMSGLTSAATSWESFDQRFWTRIGAMKHPNADARATGLGLRRQVRRDAAFLPDAYSVTSVSCHPKAPSPLRSAGAIQNLAGRSTVHGKDRHSP